MGNIYRKRQQTLATLVAFVGIHVHTKSFNILHHVLRNMDEIETLTFLGAGFLLIYLAKKAQRNNKGNRRTWACQWVRNRPEHGDYNGIMRELRETDSFCSLRAPREASRHD